MVVASAILAIRHLLSGQGEALAWLILAAYVSYALNAAQNPVKLRRSRLHRAALAAVPTA